MEAKILYKRHQAVVVAYDGGMGQEAVIISSKDVPSDARVGDFITVPDKVIADGTEYGVDWTVVLGTGSIDVMYELQQALRRFGVWTLEDFQSDPRGVRDALGTVVSLVHNRLQRAVITEISHQE